MPRPSDGRATAYGYEWITRVATRPMVGAAHAYGYEYLTRVSRRPNAGATAYAYERTASLPSRKVAATAYGYERVVAADPNQLYVLDPETEQYVRVPWYVLNLDTGAWQQVL